MKGEYGGGHGGEELGVDLVLVRAVSRSSMASTVERRVGICAATQKRLARRGSSNSSLRVTDDGCRWREEELMERTAVEKIPC